MTPESEPKIDCVVRVVTPENIEFDYLLAGPFQRMPAFLIDWFLRVIIFSGILFVGLWTGGFILGNWGVAATMTLGMVMFLLFSWLYGAIMEAHFDGRTVGKILLGLRVISIDGRPINGSQATLRNMLRACDLLPPLSLTLFDPDAPPVSLVPTFMVGLVTMGLTSRMQRIGDLAAGTMVVYGGRRGFNVNMQPEDGRAFALAEHVPPTFQVTQTMTYSVGLYMERRRFWSPHRREEVAAVLARPLIRIFELLPDTSYDLLLCALYVHIYYSPEQRQAIVASVRAQQHLQRQAGWQIPNSILPQVPPPAPIGLPDTLEFAGSNFVPSKLPVVDAQPIDIEVLTTLDSSPSALIEQNIPNPRKAGL